MVQEVDLQEVLTVPAAERFLHDERPELPEGSKASCPRSAGLYSLGALVSAVPGD